MSPLCQEKNERGVTVSGKVACGERLKAIAQEVFHTVLTFAKQLCKEGKLCQHVMEIYYERVSFYLF